MTVSKSEQIVKVKTTRIAVKLCFEVIKSMENALSNTGQLSSDPLDSADQTQHEKEKYYKNKVKYEI
jgi:hypothetical protein